MAKMFLTLEEAAQKSGRTVAELRELCNSGQLQEFRDRDIIMVKVEQIDQLPPLATEKEEEDNGSELNREDVMHLLELSYGTGLLCGMTHHTTLGFMRNAIDMISQSQQPAPGSPYLLQACYEVLNVAPATTREKVQDVLRKLSQDAGAINEHANAIAQTFESQRMKLEQCFVSGDMTLLDQSARDTIASELENLKPLIHLTETFMNCVDRYEQLLNAAADRKDPVTVKGDVGMVEEVDAVIKKLRQGT